MNLIPLGDQNPTPILTPIDNWNSTPTLTPIDSQSSMPPSNIVHQYAPDYDSRNSSDQQAITSNIQNQRDAYTGIEGSHNDMPILGGIGSFFGNVGRTVDQVPGVAGTMNVLNRVEQGGKSFLGSAAADATGLAKYVGSGFDTHPNYIAPWDAFGQTANSQYLQDSPDLQHYQGQVLNSSDDIMHSISNSNPLTQAIYTGANMGLDPINLIPYSKIGDAVKFGGGLLDAARGQGDIADLARTAARVTPTQEIDATGNAINDAAHSATPKLTPIDSAGNPLQDASTLQPINRAVVPNDFPQSAGMPRQSPLPDFARDPNLPEPLKIAPPQGVDANQAMQVGHELDAAEQTRNPIQSLNQKINYANALPDADRGAFQNLVNTRNSIPLEAIRDASIFKPLDGLGIQAIHDFESGAKGGLFDQAKSLLDSQLAKEQAAGLDVAHLDNYIPHKYANSLSEINQATGKYLGRNPGFTKIREIPTYKDAIAQGLTPKTDKISELIQQRITEGNKAIANKQYFDNLVQKGHLVAPSEAPQGWVDVTKLPYKSSYTDIKGTSHISEGYYKAPPQIARVVNNYLGAGDGLSKVANVVNSTKATIMSAGIPGTAINAHGFNIMARATQAANNPIQGLVKGLQYSLRPNSASKFLEANMNDAIKLVKNGMTMKTEGMEFAKSIENGANVLGKLGNTLSDLKGVFEKPLFQKVIPGLKTYYGKNIAEDLIKNGMDETEAYKTAAHQMNTVFGGINYDELGRSKTFQNMLRITFFAPDWAETNLRIAGSIGKSANFTDKSLGVYRNYARNLILAYAGANVANKAMTGHWMYENAPGNEFNLELPGHADDGSLRSVRLFGTANDFIRLPFSGASGIAKGDGGNSIINTFKSHMNPLVNSITEELANKDYLGRAVRPDATHSMTPQQLAVGQMNAIGNNFIPPQLVAGVNAITGNANADQTVASLTGAPLRDTQGPTTDVQKKMVAEMQKSGMNGDQINQALQNYKARYNKSITPTSNSSGTPYDPSMNPQQSSPTNGSQINQNQQAPRLIPVGAASMSPSQIPQMPNPQNNPNQSAILQQLLQSAQDNVSSGSGGGGKRSMGGGSRGLSRPGTYKTALNGKVTTTRLSLRHRRPTKGYPYKSLVTKKKQ